MNGRCSRNTERSAFSQYKCILSGLRVNYAEMGMGLNGSNPSVPSFKGEDMRLLVKLAEARQFGRTNITEVPSVAGKA